MHITIGVTKDDRTAAFPDDIGTDNRFRFMFERHFASDWLSVPRDADRLRRLGMATTRRAFCADLVVSAVGVYGALGRPAIAPVRLYMVSSQLAAATSLRRM